MVNRNNMYGKSGSCRPPVYGREGGSKALTMDLVESLMLASYSLVWVDYRDNLYDSLDIVGECIKEKSAGPLYEKAEGWYDEQRFLIIREIWGQIKAGISGEGFDEDAVEEFMEAHRDDIMDAIYERDDSDAVSELVRHTQDVPVRVELLSDYDCINSHWLESQGGYVYPDSYFGDMVDALNLNPAKVKRFLAEKGITVYGRCHYRRSRDGRELVSYEDFHRELVNSCCGANLLTYTGKVNLMELYESGFSVAKVTIPKDNYCGIFSSMYGGGSAIGMRLRRDVTLELETGGYRGYRLVLDASGSGHDYSIGHVYGVDDSFFDGTVKLTPANHETV